MKNLLGILVIVLVVLHGCYGQNPGNDGNTTTITEILCQSAGGHWNPCGSACRGAPEGTVCTMQCVPYCECGGIAGFGCPAGYQCGDYLPKNASDAMGICIKG